MSRLAVLAVAAVLAIPALARAQAEPARAADQPYSEAAALGLSVGATVAGVGVMALGAYQSNDALSGIGALTTFVGPSVGHLYTHELLTRGLAIRTAGFAAAATGVLYGLSSCPLFADDPCDMPVVAPTLMVLGVAAYLVGTADDIITAPMRAARLNRAARAQVTLAPTVTRDHAGLAVAGTF